MSIFQRGLFTAHAGAKLDWKIECDALTDDDLKTLAYKVGGIATFGRVHGVPTGGLRFAQALDPYRTPGSRQILIVDDVLTSGASMKEAYAQFEGEPITGLVIFARGQCPYWVVPLFQLPQLLW